MARATLWLLASLLAATRAVAADDAYTVQCKYDGTQQEMNVCALRDYKKADAALNQKYKEVMSTLAPAQQKALREQQRAWLKQRHPHCKAETAESEGGSIWPAEFYGCLQSATELRTREVGKWRVTQ